MAVELERAGDVNTPDVNHGDGRVSAQNNPPEKQELLHRPHAFALMHGSGGAKVAYGELLYRIDVITMTFLNDTEGVTISGGSGLSGITDGFVRCTAAGQEAIGNITQVVPKFPTHDGTAMDPNINETKYHDLGSFGDVYLVWKVNLEETGVEVEKCWVQVGVPAGSVIAAHPSDFSTSGRRTAGSPTQATGQPEGADKGVYYVKLGSVNESAEVSQKVSSDVFWSPTVLDRIEL